MTLNDMIDELKKFQDEYGKYEVNSFNTVNKDVEHESMRILLNDGNNVLIIGLKNE